MTPPPLPPQIRQAQAALSENPTASQKASWIKLLYLKLEELESQNILQNNVFKRLNSTWCQHNGKIHSMVIIVYIKLQNLIMTGR